MDWRSIFINSKSNIPLVRTRKARLIGECLRRDKMYDSVPIGSHRRMNDAAQRRRSGCVAAVAFIGGAVVSLFFGLLALNERGLAVPTWVADGTGYCVRVSRSSDYPIAAIPIGTPPRIFKLLVRLDRVVPRASVNSALLVFAEELLRSETLRCSETRNCTDVALLTTDTKGSQTRALIGFTYGSVWSGEWSIETSINAEGTISLVDGYSYELTRTHFCWRDDATAIQSVAPKRSEYPLSIADDGVLYLEAGVLRDGPVHALSQMATNSCNTSIVLFPRSAVDERHWLALSSDFLFEASTSKLDDRRAIVEQGLNCAPKSNQRDIYRLDCGMDVFSACRLDPSLPFRRVSQYELSLIFNGNASRLSLERREALSRLVGASTIHDAVFSATIRLVVLLIVAFVVFNRAERVSASAFSIIKSALDVAAGREKRGIHTWFNALTDAAVGSLAILSRMLVLWHQSAVLIDDGSRDLVVWECVAVVVSTAHFLLRNMVLKIDLEREAPLSKLGGSMSLVDASVAALMSVVNTPMLGASARDFDAVSRLFCGVLISLFVFHRLFFSVSACAMLATTTASNGRFDRSYSVVLWISCALWSLQAAAVSFAFGRLFVVPQAFSLVRVVEGGPRATESAVLLGAFALSVPYFNSVAHRLGKLDV